MDGLEVTVLLGLVVLISAVASPRVQVAPPLLMVICGLVLGFVPALRRCLL